MKKIIKILQENIEPLIIEDENDEDINLYISNLSKLLSIGNVTILETSSSSLIIRPHKIVSIIVTQDNKAPKKSKEIIKPKTTKPKEIIPQDTIQEDIITDG